MIGPGVARTIACFSDGDVCLYGATGEMIPKSTDTPYEVTSYRARLAAMWSGQVIKFTYLEVIKNRQLHAVVLHLNDNPWSQEEVISHAEGTFDEMWDKFEAYARML